jgi:glycosyltransferase involved in cell wall biosynthesis
VRVLMAVPQYPYPVVGGLERQAHELAKALLERGVGVQVVSGKIEPSQAAEELVEGVLVHRIPWSKRKAWRFLRTPIDLFRVLYQRRNTYEVVHLHQFSWFGVFVILVAGRLGKPVLTKLPSVGIFGLQALAASRFGALKLAIFKQTDAVVAMSRDSLAELEGINFPLRRVLATPNGIRMPTGGDSSSAVRATAGHCRVVFVGRLGEEKRIDELLHAWKRVVSSASGIVRLELWGTGPLESMLKALCVNLGISDSVIFRGHVDLVRDRLEEMDVFVLNSTIEGNSNAILEAMAAGLPVVSTRVGGTPMLVGADGARFLVEPGDQQGLYARLLELIEDKDLRLRIGDAMRQRILAHFDIRLVSTTYAAAYQLLAEGMRDEISAIGNSVITEK